MATYVLVHGAWLGGIGWKGIRAALRAEGHEVFNPTMTGLGERSHLAHGGIDLTLHVRDITNTIETEDLRDIILVGHSYGGMVITQVSSDCADRIRSLVYLDAFLPKNGQALWDLADEPSRKHFIDSQKETPGLVFPLGRPSTDDLSMLKRQPLLTITQAVKLSGAEKAIKNRTYIYATKGAPTAFTGFYEEVKADPAWNVRTIDTGHLVMFEDPEGLTRLLLEEAAR